MMKKILVSVILILVLVLSGCDLITGQFGSSLSACPSSLDSTNSLGLEGAVVADVNSDSSGAVDSNEASDSAQAVDSDIALVDTANENAVEETVLEELPVKEAVQTSATERMTFDLSADEELLPKKELRAGQLVEFPNLQAVDPDGDELTYIFSSPLDETGKWQTKEGDEGKYTVTLGVSDGVNLVEQDVLLLIEPANYAPLIKLLSEVEVREGDKLLLQPEVSDLDGDDVTLAFSGWKDSSSIKTTFDDAGEYVITVTASDGKDSSSKDIKVIVNNVNRAPTIEPLDIFQIVEEENFKLAPAVSDLDGDDVTLTFTEPLNEDGEWTPVLGDAGNYQLKVSASDGDLTTEESFFIVVDARNLPPVLKISDLLVEEGETVELAPEVSDPEGEAVTVSYSGWMTSNTKETGFDDAGEYLVTVKASDGERDTKKEITITVQDKNRPPVFDASAFN